MFGVDWNQIDKKFGKDSEKNYILKINVLIIFNKKNPLSDFNWYNGRTSHIANRFYSFLLNNYTIWLNIFLPKLLL